MASPLLERLLHHYQQLGVVPSTPCTYQTRVKALQNIQHSAFSDIALTLCYFCYSLAQRVLHNTIKVYLVGIHLEHIERNLPDPQDATPTPFMNQNREIPRKQEKNLPANHNINLSLAKDTTLAVKTLLSAGKVSTMGCLCTNVLRLSQS